MIIVETPDKRYRATLRENPTGIVVTVYDRGLAQQSAGREISVTTFLYSEGATLPDVRTAVFNHLLTLPGRGDAQRW